MSSKDMNVRLVSLMATAIVLAGCAAPPPPTGSPAVASPPSLTPPDSALPEPSSAERWGPLAVIPPQDGSDTARLEGTIRLTDACVVLEKGSSVTLLFWPADRTVWNAESRAISFTNVDGSVVSIRDGDAVVLGGGGDSEGDGDLTRQEWADATTWIARPDAACLLAAWWGVGDVRR